MASHNTANHTKNYQSFLILKTRYASGKEQYSDTIGTIFSKSSPFNLVKTFKIVHEAGAEFQQLLFQLTFLHWQAQWMPVRHVSGGSSAIPESKVTSLTPPLMYYASMSPDLQFRLTDWQYLYLYRRTQVIIKQNRLGNTGIHSDRSLLYSCDLFQSIILGILPKKKEIKKNKTKK